MLNLFLCKNCLSIISDANNIEYFSSNNEILALKKMVYTISFDNIPINSLDNYLSNDINKIPGKIVQIKLLWKTETDRLLSFKSIKYNAFQKNK